MSYQYVPSLFRIPDIPDFRPPNGIWRGKGRDEGLFSFDAGYDWGRYVIVRESNFCYRLKFGDHVLTPVFTDINGYIYWEGSGYIYNTQTYGWVWCDKFPGYEPIEDYEFDSGEDKAVWSGDRFYTFSSPPSDPEDEVKMTPRGALRDESESDPLKATWPRWVAKSGEFGIYEGTDGEEGEKVKGLPRFKGNGEYFVRSLNKENGYFTYGRIHYASGRWVIGEVGSPGGWHEGSEPGRNGSVTFRFVKPEGSEAKGSDISVSFDSYICGDETDAALLGSVAVWR